ncbi:SDR family NAD(P)-dependent oxidoreductase [Paeniglutamicibacter psychrophenolicus]|uniref:3-oxoacyl-[acyl-carrier protein] reductase n=1 Tax=Paeniglutamicibacter psychrophenolicus TaxID=257454 RepID=A0ABS4WHP0_9MICC|nr:SDR family NAD(P)-dependent oxidoreductase [Paeniglutamicibacter psychrophenolicus]MBP2375648.1 3-oxoacyl-[acyl-carrier protein] reductase [Paeniglutamicibacter psychrophenolicus]
MTITPTRCAVVTGAAGGIGQGIVESFLATGDTVIAVDSAAEALSTLRSKLGVDTNQLRTFQGDVTDPASWAAIAAETIASEAKEIILVNNAGISPKRDGERIPGVEVPYEEWSRVMDVNLTGPFLGIQALAPLMKQAKFGRIINMSSLAGRDGGRLGGVHYAATKTGLLGVTRYFARELAPDGITVNAIAPGRIGVGMVGTVSDEVNTAYLSRIPVGRLGSSSDVAQAVQYLAASNNGFVTGVTVDVNGGSYMG